MIDLCKVFGVEEGEEFKFADDELKHCIYKIEDNVLRVRNLTFKSNRGYLNSTMQLNTAVTIEVIKLPKKKEFSPFEYEVFRRIDPKYKWVARDRSGNLYAYADKPEKLSLGSWGSHSYNGGMSVFNHLFKSITAEDEEPLFIDDYVKR